GLAYIWRQPLIELMRRPLGQPLFYTSPTAGFNFVMELCLLAGFLLALPVLCYQLVRFIEPVFTQRLRGRDIVRLISTSSVLVLAGVAFGYYLSLPAALRFFTLVGSNDLRPLISADQYLRFLLSHLAIFAAAFQLPLLLLVINRFTPLDPRRLGRARRYVIVGAFALALIVPWAPDPLSQLILALPIIALYELSILLVRLSNRHRLTDLPPPPVIPRLKPAVPKPPQPPAKRRTGPVNLRDR
ncbi:MAG TPA: twin-arginine translocase subunit TatC, partial [Candidatus Saccharimonas sp.]|nr:twin-arginine translocase subunit TatC [Candidatus Saccharimonas sp.]